MKDKYCCDEFKNAFKLEAICTEFHGLAYVIYSYEHSRRLVISHCPFCGKELEEP